MSTDPTEDIRRLLISTDFPQARLEAVMAGSEPVWSTADLSQDFEVMGFMAPYVVVKRKSDGVKGSMCFTHSPRFYFDFTPST